MHVWLPRSVHQRAAVGYDKQVGERLVQLFSHPWDWLVVRNATRHVIEDIGTNTFTLAVDDGVSRKTSGLFSEHTEIACQAPNMHLSKVVCSVDQTPRSRKTQDRYSGVEVLITYNRKSMHLEKNWVLNFVCDDVDQDEQVRTSSLLQCATRR